MATIVAQASGNWSAGATWTGGVKPGSGDIAQTGNYNVTIDEAVTCIQLEATGTGYFTVSAAGISITANIVTSHTVSFQAGVRVSNASGTTTITGTVTGGSGANYHALAMAGAGALVINGNVTGGGAGNFALNVVAGTVTVNGNVTGGSATSAIGLYHSTTTTCTVNGTATGGSGGNAYGAQNVTTGTLVVTTAVAGSGSGAVGILGSNSGGTTRFKIAQFGVNGATPVGGYVKLVVDATVNYIRVKRSDTGADYDLSNDYPAEADVEAGVVYQLGTKTGSLPAPDYPAVGNVRNAVSYGSGTYTGTMTLPTAGNVRSGSQYGAAGTEYTGTAAIPSAGDVRSGVSVDATTGTLALPSAADVRDGTGYGAAGTEHEGTLDLPAVSDVQSGVTFDGASKTGTFVAPAVGDVQSGVTYGAAAEFTGTFAVPAVEDVRAGEQYGAGGTEFTGTYAAGGDPEEIAAAVLVAMNAAPPAVNVTFSAGIGLTGRLAQVTDLPAAAPSAATIADQVLDEALAGHAAAGSVGKALADIMEDTGTTLPGLIAGGGAGSGTGYYSDTVTDGADPLDGVRVQLSTDAAGSNRVYEAFTDALGVFEMWPDPGTYYRWLDLAGYTFTQGVEVEVTEL